MITTQTPLIAQFYDLDPMGVVWHGHYTRFLEEARCTLLDHIGYNYSEMKMSSFIWPIVDMRIKYVRPIKFHQAFIVSATLVEYINRLKIDYVITDATSQEVLTKASTVQVAVDAETTELCLESPAILIQKVEGLL